MWTITCKIINTLYLLYFPEASFFYVYSHSTFDLPNSKWHPPAMNMNTVIASACLRDVDFADFNSR